VCASRRGSRLSAALLLIAANLLWAGQGIAIKSLANALGPLATALLPLYLIVFLGFLVLSLRDGASARVRAAWTFRREFFLAGICGQLLAQVGMTLGVSWSTASNGAILNLLIPIFGAVIAVWLLRERLSLLRACALILGLAGVLLLSPFPNAPWSAMHSHQVAGNLLIATGCLGSAFYNVYSKQLLSHFAALETLFFSYLATATFSLPALFMLEPHFFSRLVHLTAVQWTAFVYLAVFFYGLSMVLFLRALGTVDAVIASVSLYLMPLFGVALAYSILGEHLAPRALLGSAVILVATAILFRFDYAV
jgi:drug/metabolite transporter (DMT)-like permease